MRDVAVGLRAWIERITVQPTPARPSRMAVWDHRLGRRNLRSRRNVYHRQYAPARLQTGASYAVQEGSRQSLLWVLCRQEGKVFRVALASDLYTRRYSRQF